MCTKEKITMTIRIVTDSATDIPWDYAKENNIKVACLTVMVGDEVIKEDESFDREAYYKNFEEEKAFMKIPMLKIQSFVPKTSQPPPLDFYQAYQEHVDDGAKEIIVIDITAGLSGSINSARIAAKNFNRKNKDIKIYIIDAKSASYPGVILIKMAVEMIKKSYTGEKIASFLTEQAIKIKTVIFLPTILYLWKGGRLRTSKFILGTMLRKKPLVTMNEEGFVVPAGNAKDVESGLEMTCALSTDDYKRDPKEFFIVYGSRLDYAEKVESILKEHYPKVPMEIVHSRGSVLSHLGPESIGLITNYTDEIK